VLGLSYHSLVDDISYEGLAPVPYQWRKPSLDLPYLGKGIYTLKLLLSEPTINLGLNIGQAETTRKVIIKNAMGEEFLVFDAGNTDLGDHTLVKMRTHIILLPKMDRESEIIIHLNNSRSIDGGIHTTPVIGTVDTLTRLDQMTRYIIMSVISILVVFCVVNIYVWFIRGYSFTIIALAALSLLLALRQLVVSGIIYDFFPNLTSSFHLAIGWSTYLFGIMLGTGYFRASAPHLIPRWLVIFVNLISLIGIVIYLFQPLYVIQTYGLYYRPLTLFTTFLLVAFMVSGLRNSDISLRVTLVGGSVLLVSFAADIAFFHIQGYDPLVSNTSVGMLIFIGVETSMILNKYWETVQQSNKLSRQLKILNAQLEDKVSERTAELALKNELLETISKTDVLTGLANRRAFDIVVNKEIERNKRNNQSLVICIFDLDNFKIINDEFGHDAGDIVLKSIGKLLLDCLRDNDFPARWGGEEFCLLFPETDTDEALKVVNRVRELIAGMEWQIGEKTIKITASFGLAVWKKNHSFNMVFKQADKALYQAKQEGRNRVEASWLI